MREQRRKIQEQTIGGRGYQEKRCLSRLAQFFADCHVQALSAVALVCVTKVRFVIAAGHRMAHGLAMVAQEGRLRLDG